MSRKIACEVFFDELQEQAELERDDNEKLALCRVITASRDYRKACNE